MRIVIRHSDKLYNNKAGYGHDPPLTDRGKVRVTALATSLVKRYGIPITIVCSPYLRCRQTANILHRVVADTYRINVGISCDRLISEYLGNCSNVPIMVKEDTLLFDPPHPETFHQMEYRVRLHNDNMRDFDRLRQPIWFVTHGLIIDRLTTAMGFTPPQNIPTLSFVVFYQRGSDILGWYKRGKRIKRLKR